MTTGPIRIVLLASALALTTASAHAQGAGGGGFGNGQGKHQQKADKTQTAKPKVDEKAYNAAIKSLPDKPYDPWHGVR
jgi:hypothetical protein